MPDEAPVATMVLAMVVMVKLRRQLIDRLKVVRSEF